MTKSGVIGLSPTVPRTPSVPKYLRVISFPDRDDVPRFLHVVHPQYCRPALQCKQSHGETACQPVAGRPARELAKRSFPGETGKQRDLQGRKLLQATKQFEVVL